MDSWEENNVRIIRHVSYENFYSKSIETIHYHLKFNQEKPAFWKVYAIVFTLRHYANGRWSNGGY